MVLSCISNSKAELTYEYAAYRPQIIVVTGYESDFFPVRTEIFTGNVGDESTYVIEEDKSKRTSSCFGTFESLRQDIQLPTQYWTAKQSSPFEARSVEEWKFQSGEWGVKYLAAEENAEYSSGFITPVTGISKEDYDLIVAKEPVKNDASFCPQIDWYYHETLAPPGRCTTDSLSITELRRIGQATWIVKIYQNGELAKTVETRAYKTDPFKVESDLVRVSERVTWLRDILPLTKNANIQAFEALEVETQYWKKEVFLVDLDTQGEETGRSKIFEFEITPAGRTPYHRFDCIEVEQCPENTYQLDCGTHFCCYKDDGIPTQRIEK